MYEFLYNYVKAKYGEKAKLCCMDTDSFILYIKIDDIYEEIAEDVETRFWKLWIRSGLMKDELGRKTLAKFDKSDKSATGYW